MGDSASNRETTRRIGRWCGWVALLLLLFTVLTGYGISRFRAVDQLTFGLLNKALSFRLHHYTDVPMLVLLLIHVTLALWGRGRTAQKDRS